MQSVKIQKNKPSLNYINICDRSERMQRISAGYAEKLSDFYALQTSVIIFLNVKRQGAF